MSDFRGNGAIVTRELMIAVGGWPAAITEDIDLATKIATTHGLPIVWAREAAVWEEPVLTIPALWRQRVRWAEGEFRRSFRYAPAVARQRHLSLAARLDFALHASQLALPGAIAGAVVALHRRRNPSFALAMIAAFELFQAILAWDGLRDEVFWRGLDGSGPGRPSPARRLLRAVRAAVFHAIYLGTVPHAALLIATRRRPVTFMKTRHLDSTFEHPAESAPRSGR